MENARVVRYFTTNDAGKDVARMLEIYEAIKDADMVTVDELSRTTGFEREFLTSRISLAREKKIIETVQNSRNDGSSGIRCAEASGNGFLGISFEGENCSMTVLDSRGEVSRKEKLPLPSLKTLRGRVGEIKDIIKTVSKETSFKGIPLHSGGVVIHCGMEGKEKKGIAIAAEGLSKIFKCEVIVARRATAAAYAEKQQNQALKGKNTLYMHTDSGEGVLIHGEKITESRAPGQGKESYLRAWDQFDAVMTAKELVKKGLGTDIVSIVKGNVEEVAMTDVLVAAEKGDELARDLVKRSALALGVRSAYLSNIFDVDMIVLGGGIERQEGGFKEHMKESFSRFVLSGKAQKIGIVSGISGNDVYSLGAALLCRREMFTEV